MNIDTDALRNDLVDYYGTAMFAASPMAMLEVSNAENADEKELIRMARSAGLDLEQYQTYEFGGYQIRKFGV